MLSSGIVQPGLVQPRLVQHDIDMRNHVLDARIGWIRNVVFPRYTAMIEAVGRHVGCQLLVSRHHLIKGAVMYGSDRRARGCVTPPADRA